MNVYLVQLMVDLRVILTHGRWKGAFVRVSGVLWIQNVTLKAKMFSALK
jgi:hypothetical protein